MAVTQPSKRRTICPISLIGRVMSKKGSLLFPQPYRQGIIVPVLREDSRINTSDKDKDCLGASLEIAQIISYPRGLMSDCIRQRRHHPTGGTGRSLSPRKA